MLSIRLSRVGKRGAPVYRVVVMPKHNDPWAVATEILGHYNPRKNPPELVLNAQRVKYWIDKGAQASDTMWNLLVDEKIVEGKKRNVTAISGARAKKLQDKAADEKAKADEAAKVQAQAAAKEPEIDTPTEEAPPTE